MGNGVGPHAATEAIFRFFPAVATPVPATPSSRRCWPCDGYVQTAAQGVRGGGGSEVGTPTAPHDRRAGDQDICGGGGPHPMIYHDETSHLRPRGREKFIAILSRLQAGWTLCQAAASSRLKPRLEGSKPRRGLRRAAAPSRRKPPSRPSLVWGVVWGIRPLYAPHYHHTHFERLHECNRPHYLLLSTPWTSLFPGEMSVWDGKGMGPSANADRRTQGW